MWNLRCQAVATGIVLMIMTRACGMKNTDRMPKDHKPIKSDGKASSTESGRVAGQLGGLYVRDPAKQPPTPKGKSKSRAREHD